MIILRQKRFSVFNGNKQLRDEILKHLDTVRPKNIGNNELPEDILKLFTIYDKFKVKNSSSFISETGTTIGLFGEQKILDQLNGRSPFGLNKINEKRIILANTTSQEYFTIAWYMESGKYKIAKEVSPFGFITKGVNKLFGQKNFEIYFSTDSLQKAFNWLNKNVITL